MLPRLLICAVFAVCATAAPGLTQTPGLTKDEAKCQAKTGTELSNKLIGGRAKCVGKCLTTQRKTSGPYTACFAPYSGATLTCITDTMTQKGVDDKVRAAIAKACVDAPTKDRCPECFGGTQCSTGDPLVSTITPLLELFSTNVYCVEFGGGTPSPAEAKCEDGLSKGLVKFVASKGRCYTKCNQKMEMGSIPLGSCTPPTPTDLKTQQCIQKAEDKAKAALDKACFVAPAVAPSCYDGSPARPNTAAGWVSLVETAVDVQVPLISCGFPSGAFLD